MRISVAELARISASQKIFTASSKIESCKIKLAAATLVCDLPATADCVRTDGLKIEPTTHKKMHVSSVEIIKCQ